jgi:glycosyltransferase involved in cell wall biosynthesis
MIGIKYISPADNSGYGVAAKAYLKGLIRSGIPVTWTPLVKGRALGLGYESFNGDILQDVSDDKMLRSVCGLRVNYDTVIIHAVPEYISHFISREPEKRWIAYTAWETDIIPTHWPKLFEPCRGILVPSHFSKQAFLRRGVSCPVHVIPHIAMEQRPSVAEWFQDIDPGCFVFYTIAEWVPRKACDLTVQAYLRAFKSSDNCRLIIKTGPYDQSLPGWRQRLFPVRRQISRMQSCYKQPARIELIDKNISKEQIDALHRRGDCFVSLTRGEGWGLGAFEAAAAGNPVVISGYGGQIEYLPGDYPYLVDYNLVHVKQNRRWNSYGADQLWAEPKLEHAVYLLRRLAKNLSEARLIGEMLKTRITRQYGEKVVIKKLLNWLRQL